MLQFDEPSTLKGAIVMGMRIAIEIGGTKLQAALGDDSGRIESVNRTAADPAAGRAGILTRIPELIPADWFNRAERVGIGFGGPVDTQTGRTVTSHQVDGWDDFPLAQWTHDAFDLPCAVENDTNCAGLAEAVRGAGRGGRCVFYSNIGSGIGGAIVIDGKVHVGRYGGGELGHTLIWDRHAERYATVESLCSGWALQTRARALAEAGQTPRLLALAGGDAAEVTTEMIGKALANENAEDGLDEPSVRLAGIDEGAIEEAGSLLDELAGNYAVALANMIALVNPDRIVIGGGVSLIGKPLFGRLEGPLRELCFAPYRDNWTLAPAQLGDNVVLVGALLI
jgi:glucokinase